MLYAGKGQAISKANYGILNSSKKQTKNHYPEHLLFRKYQDIDFLFDFEINWPLGNVGSI